MGEQKNYGSENVNISNSNNQISCVININGQNTHVDILSILKAITQNFEKEDAQINKSLPDQILINKINGREAYQTVKIITSLLQLGIPLVATYEIVQATINRIKEYIYNNSDSANRLTTKDIRQMVSNSIQEMDIEKFSYSDIENWNNRYIRRYGHNNKRIQVYFPYSETKYDISYDFINRTLLADIIKDVSKGRISYESIPSRYKKEMATEVLSFINSCDLYKISYNVLKDIIKEIALQPPHPWLINDEMQNEIINYDAECLRNNIKKLKAAIDNNVSSPQSVKIEVLHHSSALILEKYDHFLGCYDLSSFYLFKDLLNELLDCNRWNLTVGYSKLSELIADLSFAFIEPDQLKDTVDRINHFIKNNNINNGEFDKLLLRFSENAIRLFELGHKNDVLEFLKSDWSKESISDAITNLKLLLYSIYPIKHCNLEPKKNNYFWINYKFIRSEMNIKSRFFVVYNAGDLNTFDFLEHLTSSVAKNVCNVILAIAENEQIALKTRDAIEAYLHYKQIEQIYMVFWLNKSTAKQLFLSQNKAKFLEELMQEQLDEQLGFK